VSGRWSSRFHIAPGILVRKRMGGEGPVLTKMNDDEEWRQMSPFAVWLPSHLQRRGTWISYQKVMGEGGVLLSWLAPWLYYPPRSRRLVGPSCGRIVLMGARLLCDMSASDVALACHSCCIWGMQLSLRAVGEDRGWWWLLVRVAMQHAGWSLWTMMVVEGK